MVGPETPLAAAVRQHMAHGAMATFDPFTDAACDAVLAALIPWPSVPTIGADRPQPDEHATAAGFADGVPAPPPRREGMLSPEGGRLRAALLYGAAFALVLLGSHVAALYGVGLP